MQYDLAEFALKMFEYYTFLHHSQTITYRFRGGGKFEYHTFLHHSQTGGDG